eukprot:g17200.t1
MHRGALHSGSQTPGSARRALPLMAPGSVPSLPGSAFTSASSMPDLEVQGLEDLERLCKPVPQIDIVMRWGASLGFNGSSGTCRPCCSDLAIKRC